MQASPETHPSDDTLELYSLRRLPENDVVMVEEHLLFCEECRDRLEETDVYVAAMYQALRESEPSQAAETPKKPSRWAWVWAMPKSAWAGAGVLAAVALMLVFLPPGRENVPLYQMELSSYRGAPASAPIAPAETPLSISLDLTALPESSGFRVEVADAAGAVIHEESISEVTGASIIKIGEGLDTGQYWIRIYAPGPENQLLREYGLQVK